jgi:4-hydroxy-L-threonine phosphate dehydrogenase PdxA
MAPDRSVVGVTTGDPSGIGPEIFVKASGAVSDTARVVVRTATMPVTAVQIPAHE